MRIKTKVSLGVVFLFGVTLIIGGVGLFYLNRLSGDARNILKDNYESLEYMGNIFDAAGRLPSDSAKIKVIEENVMAQESNVTEPAEREATVALRNSFEKLRQDLKDSVSLEALEKSALEIQKINMAAMVRKNEITQQTAGQASAYLIAIGTIFLLIAFTFIVNFPGYIGNPIAQLTNSIKAIANRNYEERLHFDRTDEFEELANAFNSMAEKLDEYEHSNLANVLFEKRRIEAIINRMHDPIIGLDQKRRIIFVNSEALELLNLKEENVVGQYAPDIALSNDLLRDMIRDLSKSDGGSELLKIFAHGKESYFNREVISITHTPTGERKALPIGTVVILKNITPFKEQDLAKTNFIATISHELKTPLASLQMGIRLLQDKRIGSFNEEQQRILQTVSDESDRLMKITGELLDLAQVETGNIKLKLEFIAPEEVIDHALEAVKFQAEQRHVRLKKDLAKNLSRVNADKDKTTWVLINLLTNAIRHSPENGDVIVACEPAGDRMQFSVVDFGVGIDPKYKDKVFERFYQVPGINGKKGTGLGLSISKEFIEAQGGRIWVESEPGKGSKFSVSFQAYLPQSPKLNS